MIDTAGPSPEEANALRQEMKAIAGIVEAVAYTVEQHGAADLSALGARVETLCRALVALPAPEAREIGAGLPAITETLDRIARLLVQHGGGEAPSDSPVSRSRAAKAYGASMARGRR